MSEDAGDRPPRLTRAAPLTRGERRVVAGAGAASVAVALAVLGPVGLVTGASAAEVLAAGAVYGGLLGLAAAFVAVDRLQARQCAQCHERHARGAERCRHCGYDLRGRPRYACDERHVVYLDDGLCDCGRRLKPLPAVRGLGREVALTLKFGAGLLAFLVLVAVLVRLLERSL